MRGDRDRSNLILLHMNIRFPQPHLLKMLCFLERVVLVFVQISNGWSHVVSWFDIVLFHVYFCSSAILFLTLQLCDRFLKPNGNPSRLALFAQDLLSGGLLWFHMKL